jgi:purine-binding chemotaxis protein CheW
MAQQGVMAAEAFNSTAATSQFLTFLLGAEQYGVEILKVQEIRGYSAVTPIPNTPSYVKGVINLHGTVVPVVDLRAKFSMATAEYNKFTVIIVVTVGAKVTGLVVDAASDVLVRSGRGNAPGAGPGGRGGYTVYSRHGHDWRSDDGAARH